MNNTEAFEFLLSWKDDVLMNCLSGRRDKAFDPQAMQLSLIHISEPTRH